MAAEKKPVPKVSSPNKKTVAQYLEMQIDACGKTQTKIAEESGFTRPHMISMMKFGHTRLPLDRVDALAKSIGVDPIYLLTLVVSEYMPDLMPIINRIAGQPPVTENELEIIREIRIANGTDPKVTTQAHKDRLHALAKVLPSG